MGGVDVSEDRNKCNDEAEDPDCNNERDNNTPAEVFPVGLRECNYLTPPVRTKVSVVDTMAHLEVGIMYV